MLFSSLIFMAYAPMVLALWPLFRKRTGMRLGFLIAASLVFLAWCDVALAGLGLLCGILTHAFTLYMRPRSNNQDEAPDAAERRAKIWLFLVVVIQVAAFFAYRHQLIQEFMQWAGFKSSPAFAPPFGILFFLLQNIAYATEVYRRRLEPVASLGHVLAFSLFFPTALTGPLARPKDLLQALQNPAPSDGVRLWSAARCIILGFFLTNAVAANLMCSISDAFNAVQPATSATYWWGLAFTIAFAAYAVLHGYSLIGRGLAEWMGMPMPKGFRYPFAGGTWHAFWRRFFPSLRVWLYLYVAWPLRRYLPRQAIPAFTVLVLAALFGNSANVWIWSGCASALLLLELAWPRKLRPRFAYGCLVAIMAVVIWVPFQALEASRILYIWQCMFSAAGDTPRNGWWWATFRSLPFLLVIMAYEAWGFRRYAKHWAWLRPHQGRLTRLREGLEPWVYALLLVAAIYLRGPSPEWAALTQNLMN
jgi:D-alanyl-lipoteichoic acid acyltransferase DltB (MBOAT superfamily)